LNIVLRPILTVPKIPVLSIDAISYCAFAKRLPVSRLQSILRRVTARADHCK